MRPLSDAQYVEEVGGSECPLCRSVNIHNVDQLQVEDTVAKRLVECHDCGKAWLEVFKLAYYEPEDHEDREAKALSDTGMTWCENCDALTHEQGLLFIDNIFERVDPGEPMPAGQCPECGALCHKVVEED